MGQPEPRLQIVVVVGWDRQNGQTVGGRLPGRREDIVSLQGNVLDSGAHYALNEARGQGLIGARAVQGNAKVVIRRFNRLTLNQAESVADLDWRRFYDLEQRCVVELPG